MVRLTLSNVEHLSRKLWHDTVAKKFTDVELTLPQRGGQRVFHVHRVVLASRSKYLEVCFFCSPYFKAFNYFLSF